MKPLKFADKVEGGIHLFEVSPTCMTGIIIGLKAEERLAHDLQDLIHTSEDLQHVEVRRAAASTNSRKIILKKAATT